MGEDKATELLAAGKGGGIWNIFVLLCYFTQPHFLKRCEPNVVNKLKWRKPKRIQSIFARA